MWTQYLSAVFFGVVLTTVQGQTMAPSGTMDNRKDAGLILAVDKNTYEDDDSPDLIHLHYFPGIDIIDSDSKSTTMTLDDPKYEIISIDADFRRSTVFMHDRHYGLMLIGANYSAVEDNAEFEYKVLRQLMSKATSQVAYDWLSRTLYWCDTSFRLIVAASAEWDKVEDDNYKIIAFDHLQYPDGITVDPINGYIFWSDNGDNPKIERAHLDGSERHTIIKNNLYSPTALEVDISSKQLYWLDYITDSILSADYDGHNVSFVTRMSGIYFYDIAVFQNVLYVNDIIHDQVITIDRETDDKRSDTISYYDIEETVYAMTVYTDVAQPLKDRDYCAEKNCDHICISEENGARCLCGEGYRLNTVTQKCDEYAGALHKTFVYANASHICLKDIRSMMGNLHYEPVCRYTIIQPTVVGPAPRRKKRQVTDGSSTTSPQPTNEETKSTVKATSTLPTTSTMTPPPPTVSPDSIKMIEVDAIDRLVFFVTNDNRIFSRSLDLKIDNDQKDELALGSSEISGLAYDPEDRNLFWSQLDGKIFVINVDSKSVVGLTNDSQFQKPKDLIVLIHQRKLAFIEGDFDSMSIQMMNLDGTNITSVLDKSKDISSLIFDKDANRFYYLLTGRWSMYYVDLDHLGEPNFETSSPDDSTYIILEYHGYFIYVNTSEDEPNLLRTLEKSSPWNTYAEFRLDDVSYVVDMVILDADRQAMKPGLCSRANGGCAHICISKLVYGVARKECECKKGFKLADDKMNCTSDPFTNDFIMILDWTHDEILQFSLDTYELRAIPTQRNYFYTSTYLDPDTLRVYWAAFWNINVMSSNLDGTGLSSEPIYYAFPYKYAKDSSTGNMYYIASYNTHVGIVTPTGINLWLNEHDFSDSELTAIAVHPVNGHVYVGVLGYDEAYVARLDMDGQNMEVLIKGAHIKQVEGIAIDFIHDHLYVSDYVEDFVIRCNLDGKDCLTIVNTTDMMITDIATDAVHLYYTSFKQDYVVRVDLQPPYNYITIGENQGLGKVSSISFYSSENLNTQPVDNDCRKNNGLGDCSTICLPKPGGKRCACEEGVDLHPDGLTCENVHLCKAVIAHTVNDETVEIKLSSSCIRRENSTCEYKCPANYVPIDDTNTMLTCQIDGWDRETHVLCKERRCAATFANGAVENGCSKNVGSVCNFTCDEGFMKSKPEIFCREDELWHGDDGGICKPHKCDASLAYGKVDATCARTIGSTCRFSCDKYYDYTVKETFQITCGENGWDLDTAILCSDAKCDDSSLMNGMVDADCVNHIGRSCPYTCDNFYINTTEKVVCGFNQKWHPNNACKMLHCPAKIMNGFVDIRCNQEVNSECRYHCDDLYTPVDLLGNITCLPSGQWNESRDLCLEPAVLPSPQTKDDEISPGLIAGIAILAIVVLALIIGLVSMCNRNKDSSSAYKSHGNIAIENPGYRGTSMSSIDINIDRRHSGGQNQ